MNFKLNLNYYFWASYHRKILDRLLEKNRHYYQGVVLDIGGRDRGNFKKPKKRVKKWIFADIKKKHQPDVVLDITNMKKIKANSIDVVNVTEVFEHIINPVKALKECWRVLKRNGNMIISAPFLYQIHADPDDFQRLTKEKWRLELKSAGFKITKTEIIGGYFTLFADMKIVFIKSMPRPLSWFFLLPRPLLDIMAKLDYLKIIKNHSHLGKFHGGYFIIASKL